MATSATIANEQYINPTHSFDVADAITYGSIEKALIVKEIRGMQVYKLRNGGQGWVYYSAAALAKKFPYMKRASIDRWMKELVDDGYLEEVVQNKVTYDRTKSYRLPEVGAQNEQSIAQNEHSNAQSKQSVAQNEQTIPSRTTSLTTPPKGNDKKTTGSLLPDVKRPDYRGQTSTTKERMLVAKSLGLKPWELDRVPVDAT